MLKMLPFNGPEGWDRMTKEVVDETCRVNSVPEDSPKREFLTKAIHAGFVAMQMMPTEHNFAEQHGIAFATANIIQELEPQFGENMMVIFNKMVEQVQRWEKEPNKW